MGCAQVSRIVVVLFGLVMGALSCILHIAGISLNWLFLLMGILIGPAVPPLSFCLTWRKATRAGAVSGAVSGIVCGILSWLVYARVRMREPVHGTQDASKPSRRRTCGITYESADGMQLCAGRFEQRCNMLFVERPDSNVADTKAVCCWCRWPMER
jgi:Na+(H+)/acetate symporter ActP